MHWDIRAPCSSCPYRLDAPIGLWNRREFEGLLAADRSTLGKIYGCHGTRKMPEHQVCGGWLLDQKRRDAPSNMLRVSMLTKPEALAAYQEISADGLDLYDSIEEMCSANGVEPEERQR